MSEEIKKIIEESRTEEELLENLDKVGRRLSDDELAAVTGGDQYSDADLYFLSICGESRLSDHRRNAEYGTEVRASQS